MRKPTSEPSYPVFEENDGGLNSNHMDWLKPRPEMDFSSYSPAEQSMLRSSLEELATFFGSRQSHSEVFWATLAERFLHFHRYADTQLNVNVSHMLCILVEMLGPYSMISHLER